MSAHACRLMTMWTFTYIMMLSECYSRWSAYSVTRQFGSGKHSSTSYCEKRQRLAVTQIAIYPEGGSKGRVGRVPLLKAEMIPGCSPSVCSISLANTLSGEAYLTLPTQPLRTHVALIMGRPVRMGQNLSSRRLSLPDALAKTGSKSPGRCTTANWCLVPRIKETNACGRCKQVDWKPHSSLICPTFAPSAQSGRLVFVGRTVRRCASDKMKDCKQCRYHLRSPAGSRQ